MSKYFIINNLSHHTMTDSIQSYIFILFCLNNCKDPANEIRIRMSNQAKSIHLWNCDLSELTLRNFLRQLSNSSTLSRINLSGIDLHHIESLPLQRLPSLTHLRLWNANLGQSHILHLRYLLQNRKLHKLMHINLGGNDLYHIRRDLGKVLLETAANHPGTIVVWLQRSNLPKKFINFYREYTKHSNTVHIVGDDHDSHYQRWKIAPHFVLLPSVFSIQELAGINFHPP